MAIATARAGNVIGGGDWSGDRLIPDAIRAIQSNEQLEVRYPNSTRPWQHVLDPLKGYLMLAEALATKGMEVGEAFNFGPDYNTNHTVADVLDGLKTVWKDEFNWIPHEGEHPHEAGLLHLDCSKARTKLNWTPQLDFQHSLDMTAKWYQATLQDEDIVAYTKEQITTFFTPS